MVQNFDGIRTTEECTEAENALKDAYGHSCCLARSYEYSHLMTDPPRATHLASLLLLRERHRADLAAGRVCH